jgi:hypothetical protein
VVHAVQQWNDDGVADTFGRRELERRLQLRRLGRHPEHVDLPVQLARRRHVHLERAEDRALDAQPGRVARERLRPEEQHDICTDAGKCAADETADPAGTENRVSHLTMVGVSIPAPTVRRTDEFRRLATSYLRHRTCVVANRR